MSSAPQIGNGLRKSAPETGATENLGTIFSANNDTKCRRSGSPAAPDAPRPKAWTTAQGWSPDSRVAVLVRLPAAFWAAVALQDGHSPVTVAGAAAAFNRVPIQIPCSGNPARTVEVYKKLPPHGLIRSSTTTRTGFSRPPPPCRQAPPPGCSTLCTAAWRERRSLRLPRVAADRRRQSAPRSWPACLAVARPWSP
jgi:hypothetical protein